MVRKNFFHIKGTPINVHSNHTASFYHFKQNLTIDMSSGYPRAHQAKPLHGEIQKDYPTVFRS